MPFVVLTGDWYHFQDEESNLPSDLSSVITLVNGSDSSRPSKIDPSYTESDGNIPGGCTQGALVMGRNNGGVRWDFKEGVLQLLVNLHFTGGRSFKIEYTLADGTSNTVSIAKQSKGTYCNWNVLENAGLTDRCLDVRSISLLNNNSGGEVRIYDMYIRIPDTTNDIHVMEVYENLQTAKIVKNGQLLIYKNGVYYTTQGIIVDER